MVTTSTLDSFINKTDVHEIQIFYDKLCLKFKENGIDLKDMANAITKKTVDGVKICYSKSSLSKARRDASTSKNILIKFIKNPIIFYDLYFEYENSKFDTFNIRKKLITDATVTATKTLSSTSSDTVMELPTCFKRNSSWLLFCELDYKYGIRILNFSSDQITYKALQDNHESYIGKITDKGSDSIVILDLVTEESKKRHLECMFG